jgi:hypothetical protein
MHGKDTLDEVPFEEGWRKQVVGGQVVDASTEKYHCAVSAVNYVATSLWVLV